MGEVKETLMGIGNFGGGKKRKQGQGLLRSYKGLKRESWGNVSYVLFDLLRSYKGLKPLARD